MNCDKNPVNSRQPLWTKDFTLIALGTLCIAIANYFFSATIAIYANKITGSVSYAGLATGAFFAISLGMRPLDGVLVDRYGSRPLLIVSTVLCAVACFCHNFALTIPALIVCRLLHGTGFSIFTTASATAAANISPPKRLSEAMGYNTLGVVLAMAIGPGIALSIIPSNAMNEFHRLFYVTVSVCTVAFVLMLFLHHREVGASGVKKQILHDTPSKSLSAKKLPRTFLGFEKGVVWPAIIGCLMLFALSSVQMFLPLYGKTQGWDNMGAFFIVYAGAMLVARLFAGRIADKYGPDIIMLPAFLLAAITYVAIPFCHQLWSLFIVAFPLGLAQGIFNPQISVFCITRCSKERRGSATSAYNGSLDLGMALGSVAMGVMIENVSYTFSYLFCAVLSLIAMVVYIFTLSRCSKLAGAVRSH
ncbi:MAG: MFS transporter [Veillonellales bacterium]